MNFLINYEVTVKRAAGFHHRVTDHSGQTYTQHLVHICTQILRKFAYKPIMFYTKP